MLRNSVVRNHMEEEVSFNLWRLVSDAQRLEEKVVGRGGLTLLPLSYTEQVPAAESPPKNGLQLIKRLHQISNVNKPTGTSSGEIEQVKAKEKCHRTGHEILSQH